MLVLLLLHAALASEEPSCCGNLACLSPDFQILDVLSVGNFTCGANPDVPTDLLAGAKFRISAIPGPGVGPFIATGPSWFAVLRHLKYDFQQTELPPFVLLSCELHLPSCDTVVHSVGRSLSPEALLLRQLSTTGLEKRPLVQVFLGGKNHPPLFAAANPRCLFASSSFRLRVVLVFFISLLLFMVLVLYYLTVVRQVNDRLQQRKIMRMQLAIQTAAQAQSSEPTPVFRYRSRIHFHAHTLENNDEGSKSAEASQLLSGDNSSVKEKSSSMKLSEDYASFVSLETATDTQKSYPSLHENNAMITINNSQSAAVVKEIVEVRAETKAGSASSSTPTPPPLPPLPPPSLPTSLSSSSMTIKMNDSSAEREVRSKSRQSLTFEDHAENSSVSQFACETMVTSYSISSGATLITQGMTSRNATTATTIPVDVSTKPSIGKLSETKIPPQRGERSSEPSRMSLRASTTRSRRGKTDNSAKSKAIMPEENGSQNISSESKKSQRRKSNDFGLKEKESEDRSSKRLRQDLDKCSGRTIEEDTLGKGKLLEMSIGKHVESSVRERREDENISNAKEKESSLQSSQEDYESRSSVAAAEGNSFTDQNINGLGLNLDGLEISWSTDQKINETRSICKPDGSETGGKLNEQTFDENRSSNKEKWTNESEKTKSSGDEGMRNLEQPESSWSYKQTLTGSRWSACECSERSKNYQAQAIDSKTESRSQNRSLNPREEESTSRGDVPLTVKSGGEKSDNVRSDGSKISRTRGDSTYDLLREATIKRKQSEAIRAAIRAATAAASASLSTKISLESDVSCSSDQTLVTVPWVETEVTGSITSGDFQRCEVFEDDE